MNSKIEKIEKEMQRVKEKITLYQSKHSELNKKKMELENNEIIGMIRGSNMGLKEISTLFKDMKTSQETNDKSFFSGKENKNAKS